MVKDELQDNDVLSATSQSRRRSRRLGGDLGEGVRVRRGSGRHPLVVPESWSVRLPKRAPRVSEGLSGLQTVKVRTGSPWAPPHTPEVPRRSSETSGRVRVPREGSRGGGSFPGPAGVFLPRPVGAPHPSTRSHPTPHEVLGLGAPTEHGGT